MRPSPSWLFMVALALVLRAPGASAQDTGHISANLVFSASDSVLYFTYAYRGKTGLYHVNRYTGAVRELVRPVPGIVRTLDLQGGHLVAVRARNTPGRYHNDVAAHALGDSTWTPRATVSALVWEAVQATAPERLLLVLAAEVDHSSPLAPGRARLMDLYARTASDSVLHRVSDLHAYTLDNVSLRPSGEHAYLRVGFLTDYDRDGPYQLDLTTQELRPLLPQNIEQLQPEVKRNEASRSFLTHWLSPTPGGADMYFLNDLYNVYHVDERTGMGTTIAFRRHPEVYGGVLQIRNLAAMHRSDGIALLLQIGKDKRQCLRIIQASGELTDLEVDMTPFRTHY